MFDSRALRLDGANRRVLDARVDQQQHLAIGQLPSLMEELALISLGAPNHTLILLECGLDDGGQLGWLNLQPSLGLTEFRTAIRRSSINKRGRWTARDNATASGRVLFQQLHGFAA